MFPWFKKKKSASTAKDRLTIAIMSDRDNNSYPFMDQMKAEIIEVVKKYMGVKAIEIKKDVDGDVEALSIDVQLDKKV
ncbi:cell division topological specificity factor MinE [Poseidonibacter lekithochrous]|uniref:cell division topological specificity factor MinE n=1 Tax=Poseidonibacter lekithochrous TaxID=1904463 RepID=UPI0008FC60AD|nr:cell division topological specificity factor MinE [Poseidonibacter lekithochrous]QKJ22779.1 Z-ring positioning protein, topological specificity factor MinE [Poseidonibacter lekithochrous]